MSCRSSYSSYSNYIGCRSLDKSICDLYAKYNYLLTNCCNGGGDASGNPAGNNFEIQYNNNGVFGASPQLIWNYNTNTFSIGELDLFTNAVNENIVQSNAVATTPLQGLVFNTDNVYFDITGNVASRGMYIKLGDKTSNSLFQIRDRDNNRLFSVEGSGVAIFYGNIASDLIPLTNGTYNLGENPSKPWGKLVVNEIIGSGVVGGGGVSANNIIFSAPKLEPKILYTQDIGLINNPFRTIYARNIELGSESTSSGSLRAQNLLANRTVNISTVSGAEVSGSGDNYSYQLSTGLVNGSSPAAGFTMTDSTSSKKQIIITANPSTSGDSAKILNMGFDASFNNSPNSGTEGYQLQFSTGNSIVGGKLDIKSTVNLYNKQNNKNILIDGNLGYINMGIDTASQLVLSNANTSIIDMNSSTNTMTMDNNASLTRLTLDSDAGTAGASGNSGNLIDVIGGLQMGPVKNPPEFGFPIPGSNITLGKYGWDGNGANSANVALSIQNSSPSNPVGTQIGGSGNIYCDHVRQNVFYNQATNDSSIGEIGYAAGFQGNDPLRRQYYNGGDLQNIIINVGNCSSQFVQVYLPKITEAMVGSTISVIRLRLNESFYPGNNTAGIPRVNVGVAVTPANASTDLISCPDSIFLSGGSFIAGGVGIDPYSVISAPPITPPTPYTPIGSATFIATQCGDGQNIDGTGDENYIWHYINEYPAV